MRRHSFMIVLGVLPLAASVALAVEGADLAAPDSRPTMVPVHHDAVLTDLSPAPSRTGGTRGLCGAATDALRCRSSD